MQKALFTTGTLSGKRIRLTTNTTSEPRVKYPIVVTEFSLSIPYSIRGAFSIGEIRFEKKNNVVKAIDPIPTSWFIDLSHVEQESA